MSESIPPLSSDLGSLAQSARGNHLKQVRGVLLFIGILTIALNAFLIATMESQVHSAFDTEVRNLQAQGIQVDQAERAELEKQTVRVGNLINAGALALGVVFVIFGLVVQRYPVPITVLSLVLYIGSAAVFGMIDPTTLLSGVIIKVIIVVFLIKGVRAAIAYERDRAREEEAFVNPVAGLGPLE